MLNIIVESVCRWSFVLIAIPRQSIQPSPYSNRTVNVVSANHRGFFLFISVQLRNFPDNKGSGRLPFRVSLSKVKLSHTGLRYWRFELTTCFDAVSRNLCNVICSRAVVEDLLAWQWWHMRIAPSEFCGFGTKIDRLGIITAAESDRSVGGQ